MQDGMQYDPIQGQGQSHEPLKVGNSATFKRSLLPRAQYLKLIGAGFLIFVLLFVSRDFEVGSSRSRTGLIYYISLLYTCRASLHSSLQV